MKNPVIENIVSQLFSSAASLAEKPEQVSAEERFYVISSEKGPRWIVPCNSAYGLPVLRQWRPYGAASSAKWTVLKWAYGLGQLHRLPNVTPIGIAGANSQDWLHLGYQAASDLVPVVYVGTTGSTQKAVVTLLDKRNQEILGVAKLPLGAMAATNILSEADVLTELASELPGLAPECLFSDSKKGVMVQQVLLGTPVKRDLTLAHIQWLSGLHQGPETTTIRAQAAALTQRLERASGLSESNRTTMQKVLKRLTDSEPLPNTWIHGDFAPWNLKWQTGSSRGSLVAVDWEDAKPDGLPLYDLLHYQYIQSYLFDTRSAVLTDTWQNSNVRQYAQSLGIARAQFDQIALYYLTDMWLQTVLRNKAQDADFFRSEALLLADLFPQEAL